MPRTQTPTSARIFEILREAKALAREYRHLTGRPLGVTGEVAEYEAARLLDLTLADVRQPGYDASRERDGRRVRYQIKGRCFDAGASKSQRLGKIRLDTEWDALLMVLMDTNLDTVSIHEADREPIVAALLKPGSRSRNERGALSVSAVKRLGRRVWSRDDHQDV